MTFYEKLVELCQKKGVAFSRMAFDCGFSSAAAQGWKKMSAPPRASTVKKIADYFGVSVDYFYKDIEGVPPTKEPEPKLPENTSVAFAGGDEDLTPEDIQKVLEFIKFLKSQHKS